MKRSLRLFRIYTENKNYETVIKPLLEVAFDGFTVYRGEGNWKGETEKSLLVEIYTRNGTLIRAIARAIKQNNGQEAVLVTETACKVRLI